MGDLNERERESGRDEVRQNERRDAGGSSKCTSQLDVVYNLGRAMTSVSARSRPHCESCGPRLTGARRLCCGKDTLPGTREREEDECDRAGEMNSWE